MVLRIVAYVLGRPMPFSSSSLTKEASENRGGGREGEDAAPHEELPEINLDEGDIKPEDIPF